MTSKSFLDEFGDSLANLPVELHRNFTLMQELDSRSQKLMTEIDNIAGNYMSNVQKNSKEEKKETMASIQRKFDAAKELSDDKIQLSTQAYELVDKRILTLDSEIARFKAKIKLKSEMSDAAIKAKKNLQTKTGGTKMTSAAPSVSAVSDPTSSVTVETKSLTGALVDAGVAHSVYADMPIDPNEPTFCLCNQVSFGEMIGCDNPDCAIDWFHFACVNLVAKPKGIWFCPKCAKDKKKK
ncbi:inhibitor of growth protein 4-like [Myzus persicae]|uniref:inhibitor of growth protein 4-like n=1 Tax=Myzus persicae TaxID=13164 RepID=UPI000B9382B0|nr:inhibitor of growth protein 4-like [Myzus persicae]